MNKRIFLIMLAAVVLPLQAQAEAVMLSAASFREVSALISRSGAAEQTLLVMDDDDTLTMMPCSQPENPDKCQYLGGPAWSSWQQNLIGTSSPYRVAASDEELFSITSVLFAMNFMAYSEPDLPAILQQLSSSGVRFVVETARGGGDISATENQLENLQITDASSSPFLHLISAHALQMPSGQSSLASPFIPCALNNARPVSYRQGVMYVAGQNKGEMLLCLLSRAEPVRPVKHIVFVDDTDANVKDVYAAFKDNPDYQVSAVYYTRLEQHKAALTRGPMSEVYQKKADERWQALKSVLHSQLQWPSVQ